MKKRLLSSFLLLTMVCLSSCSGVKSLTIDEMKTFLKDVPSEETYPYYRVVGAIDFNNTYMEVDHEFTNDFREKTYIPYTRFNPGTYDPNYDPGDVPESEIMNFANGSRSYWTRMPLRVNAKNFYGTVLDAKKNEILNSSSSYSLLFHLMKSWADSQVKNADPAGTMIMEILKDQDNNPTGFAFSGNGLHSKITVDNFPEYADPENTEHWPYGIDYDFDGPFPMYKNQIDATFNFRFEYNMQGWLTREFVSSTNYKSGVSSDTQFYCEALYTYTFGE